jgi:dinuclear metal center YbgI/SA1388 family protein
MKVADLVRAMEAIAPARLAAAWDNVGLLVGDEESPLASVLLAIDCTPQVAHEARIGSYSAVVSYHPPIFDAQRRFLAPSVGYDMARAGIAIHSPHTAFDAADGGTNDVLADVLGMTGRSPLRKAEPCEAGYGRIGRIETVHARELVDRVKRGLGLQHVLLAGPPDRDVSRVAVCAGSGGELVGDAIASGAEFLLTGELRHHDALRAAAAGVTTVCTLHSESERPALVVLERRLTERLPGVRIARSRADREVFAFA